MEGFNLISPIIGLFTGGANILLTVLGSVMALVAVFFRVKHLGKKEATDEMRSKLHKRAYQEEKRRRELDDMLIDLGDDELNRLRDKYERAT